MVWMRCIDEEYLNVNHIIPTRQRDVYDLIKAVMPDKNITRVYIFGKTITNACNFWEEIDVYIEKRRKGANPVVHNGSIYHIRDNYNVPKELLKEIQKYGVVVYVRGNRYRWEDLPYEVRRKYKKW